MSITFIRRFQLKSNYKNDNYETIYSDKFQFKDLPLTETQFNEIKNLKKLIAKFITLYSQDNIAGRSILLQKSLFIIVISEVYINYILFNI